MTSLDLARRYADAGVPLVLWPRDTLPTVRPPPPTRPRWVKSDAEFQAIMPELRGCYYQPIEGDLL